MACDAILQNHANHDFHLYGSACLKLRCDCLGTLLLQVKLMASCSLTPETQKMHQHLQLQPLELLPRGRSFHKMVHHVTTSLLELDMHHLNTNHIRQVRSSSMSEWWQQLNHFHGTCGLTFEGETTKELGSCSMAEHALHSCRLQKIVHLSIVPNDAI